MLAIVPVYTVYNRLTFKLFFMCLSKLNIFSGHLTFLHRGYYVATLFEPGGACCCHFPFKGQ